MVFIKGGPLFALSYLMDTVNPSSATIQSSTLPIPCISLSPSPLPCYPLPCTLTLSLEVPNPIPAKRAISPSAALFPHSLRSLHQECFITLFPSSSSALFRKTAGCIPTIPILKPNPSSQRYLFLFHTLTNCFALFCTRPKLNSLVFMRFHTLYKKYGG